MLRENTGCCLRNDSMKTKLMAEILNTLPCKEICRKLRAIHPIHGLLGENQTNMATPH